MPDSRQALLDEIAKRRGLGEAYYDHRGQLHYFSKEAREAILSAMGLSIADESALRRELDETLFKPAINPAGRCYQPEYLNAAHSWGLSVQLYTLRSPRNWGVGDFRDLRDLIEVATPLGCDVIGLNPLHALFPSDPGHCSPYSPSSRLFLNVLYICIEDVLGFHTCAPLQALYKESSFQAALTAVRSTDVVMYEQVATLKLCALRLLHAHFVETQSEANTAIGQAFREFRSSQGEALRLHSLFDVLDAHFREAGCDNWRQWPPEFQDVRSAAVQSFANENAMDVEFYSYLQWLADEQLATTQAFARKSGMRIGIYGDLAVGSNPNGSEVWSNQSLYVSGVSVGAPPDPLALNGQDWGIPPIDPYVLRTQEFTPFIELIRANMRRVGAIRIDHVMSLFRLWWVPRGFSAVEGVYVHYPFDELIAILIRESELAKCLVIGEDLGTVPDEVRSAMELHRLYHYKVLLFEKQGDRFKNPSEYVRHAVATATTHDLPLLHAWWTGEDLTLRDRLGLYPSEGTIHGLRDQRQADRYALLRAMRAVDLWHWQEHEPLPECSAALVRAIHLYLGESQAALTFVQLEDLIGMTEPVNVPGTHTEHANWQRKLAATVEDIFSQPAIKEGLQALTIARSGRNPNA